MSYTTWSFSIFPLYVSLLSGSSAVSCVKSFTASGSLPNASLSDDLGMDSLDIVIFAMELGEEFKFEILDEDIESFKTVQNVIEYIEEKENGRSK